MVATATTDNPRDRKLVTLAGVAPDLDGLGILADWSQSLLTGEPATYAYYQHYHHLLLHGWPGAVAVALALMWFARKRWRVFLLCLLAFHVHLLCDLVGSRGPTPADYWVIAYSEPLFKHPVWMWDGQWRLDGWQNKLIFVGLLGASFWVATQRGYSFVELFSRKGDAVFVSTLRKWRGQLSAVLRRT